MDTKTEFFEIVRQIKNYIRAERQWGTEEVSVESGSKIKTDQREQPHKNNLLLSLKNQALLCRKCELHKSRRNVVFGDGDPDARLMFIGEAPGFDEDLQGLPFVGQAGKLLTRMIEAMGLSRDDVYICNVLKCRPPGNRSPRPEEIGACNGYLLKQIEIISPKIICCLGKFAAHLILGTEEPISKIRGREFEFKGTVLIPTFHPAYLLRNPGDKKLAWEDLKVIKRILSED